MKLRQFLPVIAVFLILLVAMPTNSSAHEFRDQCERLESVLFGRGNYKASLPKRLSDTLNVLECAQNLCLDQFNGSGSDKLQALNEYGVPGIPGSIDSINFTGNYAHRKYTHKGWEPAEHPDTGNWDARKEIVLATVNKVFDFGLFTDPIIFGLRKEYTDQCQAFSALLYYVHIIGDYDSFKVYSRYKREGSYQIPLARAHPSRDNPDVFYDLTEIYLPKLFASQVGTAEYKGLIRDMEKIHQKASDIDKSTGGVNDEEKFQAYRECADELLESLKKSIPRLLKNETFFTDVFPAEW